MYKTVGLIFCAIVLLQGCSGSSVKEQNQPNVTSNPTGAAVFANILELGKTPLRHNLYDAFPAGWNNSIYQAQGVLVVKMNGCKDFTLKVSDYILSKPVHAELECTEENKTKKSTPLATPAAPTTSVTTTGGVTEKRLKELEAMLKKGIITKDEYKATRVRILNEL